MVSALPSAAQLQWTINTDMSDLIKQWNGHPWPETISSQSTLRTFLKHPRATRKSNMRGWVAGASINKPIAHPCTVTRLCQENRELQKQRLGLAAQHADTNHDRRVLHVSVIPASAGMTKCEAKIGIGRRNVLGPCLRRRDNHG
jgi:hypothetical protein